MAKIIEAGLQAQGKKFGIVVSRFNDFITSKLVDGALDALIRSGAKDDDITILKVPGAFEIPLAASMMAKKGAYDAIICIGAVIRGATTHYDYVCAEVSKGIASVSLEAQIPVMFGILTTETIEQAIERAGTKAGNKGFDVALGAIEMANLSERLEKGSYLIMGDRRKARELALQALFAFDMEKAFPNKNLDENLTAFCDNNEEKLTQTVKPFFLELVKGVNENYSQIDFFLEKYSKNWKISSMPVVDRNIMRIATFEFLNYSDIPRSVTINEAVEIGKKYGTRDSGSFINGVLDRIKNLENF